jgi:hypothetical protein
MAMKCVAHIVPPARKLARKSQAKRRAPSDCPYEQPHGDEAADGTDQGRQENHLPIMFDYEKVEGSRHEKRPLMSEDAHISTGNSRTKRKSACTALH